MSQATSLTSAVCDTSPVIGDCPPVGPHLKEWSFKPLHEALTDHVYTSIAKPLHIQHIERALDVSPLLSYIEESVAKSSVSDFETSTDAESEVDISQKPITDAEGNQTYNGIVLTRAERRADKSRLYNFSKVRKSRKWLKNVLLSDSSSDEEDSSPISEDDLQDMLKLHKLQKACQVQFSQDKDLQQYAYYSVGLLSNHDKFYEHQKLIVGPRKKAQREQRRLERQLLKAQLKQLMTDQPGSRQKIDEDELEDGEVGFARFLKMGKDDKIEERLIRQPGITKSGKQKRLTPEQAANKRRRIWVMIAKKEIPKAYKQKASARKEGLAQLRKVSKECQKESRRAAFLSQKMGKEAWTRARRLSKECSVYWRRFEKVEKEHRKKAEKEAQEQKKIDLELREMKRQQRKLNFLITQTELYAHFMAGKLTGATEADRDKILSHLEENDDGPKLINDDYDSDQMKQVALQTAEDAYGSHMSKKQAYDLSMKHGVSKGDNQSSFAYPFISTDTDRPQPSIFVGKLKGYQLKGMNWLANLYDQGINGILADEMGLGKTVQSIAFLSHLAEAQGIWGPFLVIAPASTLHNWQQEVSRFNPQFKVVPYWGNTQDRKVLRTFWNQEYLHTKSASFHVVITSYQLVITDLKYFQRIKWHYMVLDEAQAIKSTSSVRWKILLGFSCRNRLLLTGTPIQNTMAELWALLHFIMPTLFDSHEEFNEWFSKDIESHAERQSGIDENQLSRLHMILKPFMLRRVKKDVENELSDKIEVLVYCPLTSRQRLLYQAIKNKISFDDLIMLSSGGSYGSSSSQNSTSSLMNLVMQFRKVCNHPELFERREITSPFTMGLSHFMPKLVYRAGLLDSIVPNKHHLLLNKFYIYNPENVHRSLFPSKCEKCCQVRSCFSFTRFINMSPSQLHHVMLAGLLARWLYVFMWWKHSYRIHQERVWQIEPVHTRYLGRDSLSLSPDLPLSPANLQTSPVLSYLVFVDTTSCFYTHTAHTLHFMPETIAHRKIRLKRLQKAKGIEPNITSPSLSSKKSPTSPPSSPQKTPLSPTLKQSQSLWDELYHKHVPREPVELPFQQTDMPSFLYHIMPKVHGQPVMSVCHDRSAEWDRRRRAQCGSRRALVSLLYGDCDVAEAVQRSRHSFCSTLPQGLMAVRPRYGFSGVMVPDKEMMVTDAGKLSVLDSLLARLKSEGHRVLIYSQMTRMIDLLEEYMWHRKHTYMRLDGSSKICDRRDMVADFQSRSDIFVFLLSTRAGGLGINLTAADTVIFYDSDWNPTVDQQAMDRAHRLGQTKQVTVYRLICKGSIEERILQRAREKSEIQRMVISGGNFRPDVLRPKEVVSLLLDDDEMEKKLKMRQEERLARDDNYREKAREMKRRKYSKTGRGPGRPPKIRRIEEGGVTIPSLPEVASSVSLDSMSAAASPQSVISMGSECNSQGNLIDDSSNDGLVIVDDSQQPYTPVKAPLQSTPKRGTGRPRGRPRGSGVGRRPRGRGSVQKALGAAEAAAAAAAKSHAASYNYSYDLDSSPSAPLSTRGRRGRGRGRGKHASLGLLHKTPATPN